ncbi:hypothetical protein NHP20013_13390 [Helicobacter bizzozeronii]|nr:hypothetical protein NHP20013_13390 [Helicobacter bizzozeronii]
MASKLEMSTLQMDILDYLSKNKFVVPEYQRGYVWGLDECVQLWEDITAFFEGKEGSEDINQDLYFLGSVVIYPVKDKKHIVDGQQRTTTLMLLLKAMHARLIAKNNEGVQYLINKIVSCIWDVNGKTGKPYFTNSHILSQAISDDK